MPSALTIVEFEGKFEWKLAEYENEPTYTHVWRLQSRDGPDVASERQIHPSVLPEIREISTCLTGARPLSLPFRTSQVQRVNRQG